MVRKKVNKFSIFKVIEHDNWIAENTPDTPYGNTTSLWVQRNTSIINRTCARAQIVVGTEDPEKIPYFDKLLGFRAFFRTAAAGYVNDPWVHMYLLNDDLTKRFFQLTTTWNHYRDGASSGGSDWKKAGGDFDSKEDIGSQIITAHSQWYEWDEDFLERVQQYEDGDWLSFIMLTDTSTASATFESQRSAVTGTLPSTRLTIKQSWRGEEFGGENVYMQGIHTSAPTKPFVELIYEDEIPEQPTDLKLVPEEGLPERVNLEYSESPDEDVQGYMLFVTSDRHARDFDTLKWFDFDGQTSNFTVGDKLTGGTSGATGYIVNVVDSGAAGTVVLANVEGIFVDGEALTDEHTGDGSVDGDMNDLPAWGWVDSFDATAKTITCAGQAPNWPTDCWNTYKMIMINGKNRGKIYTVNDTGSADGELTVDETISEGEFTYNDMFLLYRDYTNIASDISTYGQEINVYAVETNRGLFWDEAPSADYPVWIKDMSQFTANEKYYFFIQAIDNLGMGERGDKSNVVSYVIPEIDDADDVNIVTVDNDYDGTAIKIYEEVYPAIYTVGLNNEKTNTPGTSTDGLKDKAKIEIETGEFRYILDTYITTLTAQWSSGTSISLDLDGIPKRFFRVGQEVCIIDRDTTPTVVYDIRTIVGVGRTTIVVDAAPGHTFNADRTQIYPVKKFLYTKSGSKLGIVKARTINEEGFASPWQIPTTAPAPIDIPGIGSLKVGPSEAEKDDTDIYFNMNLSRPKDSEATITKYALDMDDGSGESDYDEPVQTLAAYTTTGTKQPFAYIYDSNNIISPGFDKVWDYENIGTVWNDGTILAWTHDPGSPLIAMQLISDALYIGFKRPFDGVYIDFVGFWTGLTFDKEYYDGSSWQTLTVTDGTNNFTQDGKIIWTPPSDWASSSVNSSESLFWVRFTVTAVTVPSNIFILVPLELGNNYSVVTVIDPTIIDLDSVFVDGFEKHQEEHPRKIYARSGILGDMVKQGKKLIATFTLNGHSHTINDNYLSGFDASGDPVFGGAANTDNRLDDLQILDNIIENGRLVQFKDDAGTTHTGYLSGWGLPDRMEGMPVANWRINFIPDPNR